MDYQPFELKLHGVSDTFSLLEFEGEESLNGLYRFKLKLLTDNPKLDLNTLIFKEATLTLNGPITGAEKRYINGVCSEVKIGSKLFDKYRLEIIISPKLWQLGINQSSKVFLDMSVIDVIEKVFKENKITPMDYQLDLKNEYAPLEYICQYNESDLDFVMRWLEEYGISMYFEQSESSAKLVLSDDKSTFKSLKQELCLYSEFDKQLLHASSNITSLEYTHRPVPGMFKHNNHDPLLHHLKIENESMLSSRGAQAVHLFGGNPQVQSSFSKYADVEKERMKVSGKELTGMGNITHFSPGALMKVEGHYSIDGEERFLITSVKHSGKQAQYLNDGLSDAASSKDALMYTNHFTSIPNTLQYRPQKLTPKPKVDGLLVATVDSDTSAMPLLDKYGRYKVKLPFDTLSKGDGKGSCWVRMSQPSAGDGKRGFQIRLLQGDTVLLGFLEGDIDRPVILGAINTREGVVGEANSFQDVLRTSGGHETVYDNTPGKEQIIMKSKNGGVTITMS